MIPRRERNAQGSRLHRNWRPFYIAVNITADFVVVIVTVSVAYAVREIFFNVQTLESQPLILFALFFAGTFLAVALLTGLYREAYHTPLSQQKRSAARTYSYATYVILFVVYLLLGGEYLPRFTILFLVLLPILYFVSGAAIRRWARSMQKRGYGMSGTLLINADLSGWNALERFATFPELGYSIRGIIRAEWNEQTSPPDSGRENRRTKVAHVQGSAGGLDRYPRFELHELERVLRDLAIERVVVTQSESSRDGLRDILHLCEKHGVQLKVISRESEQLLRFSSVKDITGIPLYSPPKRKIARIKARFKRGFDLMVSVTLLLFLSPIFGIVALSIYLEDRGPVFFRQERGLSFQGSKFTMLKFRSMEKGAEERLHDLDLLNEAEGGLFRVKSDPRLTRVGRWIRKGSLDELPQLINVVRGEMSLVGPRPLAIHDLETVERENLYAEYYRMREGALPGMTGLWQISGRREIPAREMVFLDLYYIHNYSIAFDLEILFATIPVIAFGRGAY